jgi:hypothetical protein
MKKKELQVWVCTECGSIHVEKKCWVDLNSREIDWESLDETQDYWCKDCEGHYGVELRVIPTVNGAVRVQGYQVVQETENGVEMHPHMDASFCLYNLQQATDMLNSKDEGDWKLLTIYKGDVEEPTKMFGGDPRKFLQR